MEDQDLLSLSSTFLLDNFITHNEPFFFIHLASLSATMSSPWFYLLLLASIFFNLSSAHAVSYTKHCSSIIPQSSTTTPSHKTTFVLPYLSTPYFTGGDTLLGQKPSLNQTYVYGSKSIRLRFKDYYETNLAGTYKVAGVLFVRFPQRYNDTAASSGNYSYDGRRYRARGSVRFSLDGFWSEKSRKLCMVGSTSYHDGKALNHDAVLKLKFESENNPNLYNGVVTGVLESTNSPNESEYFDPISIFSFPVLPKYNYSKQVVGPESEIPRNQSINLEPNKFCYVIQLVSRFLELEYAEKCREEHHHCSPIGSSLPPILYLNTIECSEKERRLRYIATFQNHSYDDQTFDSNASLIGEASWDSETNQVIGIACRLLNPVSRFGDAVEDCTMRLSWRYPSILSIRDDSGIVDRIWSSKPVNDSGYFRKIDLTSDDRGVPPLTGAGYEYTEMDRVRKSCERKEDKKKGNTYPEAHSYSMRFDMSIKNKKGESLAWGYAVPVFVENDSYRRNDMLLEGDSIAPAPLTAIGVEVESISEPENKINTYPVNITYRISIDPFDHLNWSMNPHHQVEINAEGVYNSETGFLCMVGCRKMASNSSVSKDCEILVKFQFASYNAIGGLNKGTIESTRPKTDPLHFPTLVAESAAYYGEEAERTIWRMDLEITLVLISNTFACIFIALQIFHVKRNPEAPSFISLVMLVMLSVGHMIPLVLNFDAVFLGSHNKQTLVLSHGERIEANEVTIRVITMVAFLLQLRLLQLVWAAKKSDGNEKKAGFFSLALYIVGGLLTFVLNWTRNRHAHLSLYGKYSLWGDLRSYAGLILDGFLLPQILLNIFIGSAEKALSGPFYIGTSAVRLVPHAYNQYRVRNYPLIDLNSTYHYANPDADFYSTAGDILIPCGVVLLAMIVFVQQRRGGRCVLPQRFRGILEMYEKVPTVDHE